MAAITINGSWQALPVTTGTIQNISAAVSIELSETQTDGSGQRLKPHEALSFDGIQLYTRTLDADESAKAIVSPFVQAAASDYHLPAATEESLGGVKVGSGLSVSEDGVLSAATPQGSFNFAGASGKTISHTIGDTDYTVGIEASAATGGDLGDVYVSKSSNAMTIYNTGGYKGAGRYMLTR